MHPTRIFKTPEELWSAFEKYVAETKSNPRKKHVFVGKDATSEYELLERPLTLEGFEIYCYEHHGTVKHYFDNKLGYYEDFGAICSRIRQAIRRDQIEGGMVGQYNPSITQRLNNLVDKVESTIIEQPLFPDEVAGDNS